VLNAVNKFFHATIQSEEFILKILECMPYTANAIDLARRLHSIPSMQTRAVLKLYNPWNVCLENGELLSAAAKANNVDFLKRLLDNKKIDLNWPAFGHNTALMLAIQNKNIEAVKLLIAAGANPEAPHVRALYEAVRIGSKEIVELLLAAGANPNMLPDCDPTPEICELIIQAQEKRKQRMRLLCGKKDDGCAIS
jgi:ankyrin repeat protein